MFQPLFSKEINWCFFPQFQILSKPLQSTGGAAICAGEAERRLLSKACILGLNDGKMSLSAVSQPR